MATSILIGNGINRLSNAGVSWEQILRQLVVESESAKELEYVKDKPFALLYEEILLSRTTRTGTVDDMGAKRKIASLVTTLCPNEYHKRLISAPVNHILTTNYDYTLEHASTAVFKSMNLQTETKYSLFRRWTTGQSQVWHVHGEANVPNTITLGYDQYCGYLQKLRTYATAERNGEKGSPFKRGELDFDANADSKYGWLDVFFRDDIHIVGLGLDFTEIDIWWALTYKGRLARRGFAVGKTCFHDWHTGPIADVGLAKRSLLEALGVEVRSADCTDGFGPAYDAFLSTLSIIQSAPVRPSTSWASRSEV